jgi:hypothetical protein
MVAVLLGIALASESLHEGSGSEQSGGLCCLLHWTVADQSPMLGEPGSGEEGGVDQLKRVEREKVLYFVMSFLSSVTLSYYLARLMGDGTVAWERMLLPLPVLVVGFWLFYARARRQPSTLFMMNAAFAFLSLIAIFLLFQFLSALRG